MSKRLLILMTLAIVLDSSAESGSDGGDTYGVGLTTKPRLKNRKSFQFESKLFAANGHEYDYFGHTLAADEQTVFVGNMPSDPSAVAISVFNYRPTFLNVPTNSPSMALLPPPPPPAAGALSEIVSPGQDLEEGVSDGSSVVESAAALSESVPLVSEYTFLWEESYQVKSPKAYSGFGKHLAAAEGRVFVSAPEDASSQSGDPVGAIYVYRTPIPPIVWPSAAPTAVPSSPEETNEAQSDPTESTVQVVPLGPALPSPPLVRPVLEAVLRPPASAASGAVVTPSLFGSSMSAVGNRIAVGAKNSRLTPGHTGAVYVFAMQPKIGWQLESVLPATQGGLFASFGCSLQLTSTALIVSAEGDNTAGPLSGAVFVYKRDVGGAESSTNTYSLEGILYTDNPERFAFFGFNIFFSEKRGLVAAIDQELGLPCVFIYGRSASSTGDPSFWSQLTIIYSPANVYADSFFGRSLSLYRDEIVVIGSPGEDDVKNQRYQSGAVYVFGIYEDPVMAKTGDSSSTDSLGDGDDGNGENIIVGDRRSKRALRGLSFVESTGLSFEFLVKLTATLPSSFEGYGSDLAVVGDTLFISAELGNTPMGNRTGTVYIEKNLFKYIRNGTVSEDANDPNGNDSSSMVDRFAQLLDGANAAILALAVIFPTVVVGAVVFNRLRTESVTHQEDKNDAGGSRDGSANSTTVPNDDGEGFDESSSQRDSDDDDDEEEDESDGDLRTEGETKDDESPGSIHEEPFPFVLQKGAEEPGGSRAGRPSPVTPSEKSRVWTNRGSIQRSRREKSRKHRNGKHSEIPTGDHDYELEGTGIAMAEAGAVEHAGRPTAKAPSSIRKNARTLAISTVVHSAVSWFTGGWPQTIPDSSSSCVAAGAERSTNSNGYEIASNGQTSSSVEGTIGNPLLKSDAVTPFMAGLMERLNIPSAAGSDSSTLTAPHMDGPASRRDSSSFLGSHSRTYSEQSRHLQPHHDTDSATRGHLRGLSSSNMPQCRELKDCFPRSTREEFLPRPPLVSSSMKLSPSTIAFLREKRGISATAAAQEETRVLVVPSSLLEDSSHPDYRL